MGRTSDAADRLMAAALDLIWEESYGAVTIDDICKRADVKKGSFYHFYHSKADLAVKALDKMWEEESRPAMDRMFSPSIDPLERIRHYLDFIYQKQVAVKEEHGKVLGCPVVSMGSETSTHVFDVSGKVREMMAKKRRYYEAAIRDALAQDLIEPCDPAEKALALAGLIEGAVCQCRIMNDPDAARSLADNGLRLLGLKQPASASA